MHLVESQMKRGKVYLLGAGPGDLELLTIKAVRILLQADVVLLDDLVNPEIRQYLKPGAKVFEVGKRGGHKSTQQKVIHEQMVHYALSGQCVVRVKGGDPLIFGRGGEEIEKLQATGIAVEVVSGVSSGIAVPAAINIPLTHRQYAHSVMFLTGHSCDDSGMDWKAIVATKSTLIIFMGLRRLPHIIKVLLESGMPEQTLSAVIQNGTLPTQKYVMSTLKNLASEVEAKQITSPAIVVIGKVVQIAMEAGGLLSTDQSDKIWAQQTAREPINALGTGIMSRKYEY